MIWKAVIRMYGDDDFRIDWPKDTPDCDFIIGNHTTSFMACYSQATKATCVDAVIDVLNKIEIVGHDGRGEKTHADYYKEEIGDVIREIMAWDDNFFRYYTSGNRTLSVTIEKEK